MDPEIMELFKRLKLNSPTKQDLEERVDITGINKTGLLRALWDNSSPALFFTVNNVPPLSWEDPKNASVYFDYYRGRVIKMDLSKDYLIPYYYDSQECTGESVKDLVARIDRDQ